MRGLITLTSKLFHLGPNFVEIVLQFMDFWLNQLRVKIRLNFFT